MLETDAPTPVHAAAVLPDEAATGAFARLLAMALRPGDVVGLTGPLGIGKSVLARAAIRALDDRAEEIPSPTFTLVQLYEVRRGPAAGTPLFHFDLYRLERPEDAWELGIEESFATGISLVEWPERLGALRPPSMLSVTLAAGDRVDMRRAELHGAASWVDRLRPLAGWTADAPD